MGWWCWGVSPVRFRVSRARSLVWENHRGLKTAELVILSTSYTLILDTLGPKGRAQ